LDEGPVPVARDGPVDVVALGPEARPAPLVGTAVRLAHHEVDETGAQELAVVETVAGARAEILQEVLAVLDHSRGPPPRRVILAFVRLELDRAQHTRERFAELAEARVVRHDVELRLDVENASRSQQPG